MRKPRPRLVVRHLVNTGGSWQLNLEPKVIAAALKDLPPFLTPSLWGLKGNGQQGPSVLEPKTVGEVLSWGASGTQNWEPEQGSLPYDWEQVSRSSNRPQNQQVLQTAALQTHPSSPASSLFLPLTLQKPLTASSSLCFETWCFCPRGARLLQSHSLFFS